jgi:peptidoglycan/LPS O-acetylase OafA/YrhL
LGNCVAVKIWLRPGSNALICEKSIPAAVCEVERLRLWKQIQGIEDLQVGSIHSGYRPDIDGLRSLAILPVVFSHAGFAGFSGGFVGVDIFFVISGFLITGILIRQFDQNRLSILGFYERRARRILPALFVVLAACLVLGWVLFPPDRFKELSVSVIATVFFVSNIWIYHWTGDYFSPNAELEPLLHTWSLGVEEQFYIFFPLLLWVLARRWRSSVVPTIGLLVVLSFALSVWATGAAPDANFFLAPTRVWELGLGVLLALGAFPTCAGRRWVSETVSAAGLILILGSVVLLSSSSPFPGLTALPACAGAAAIIWAGGQTSNTVCRLLSNRVPVFFGLISYSLYLWHWPVLVAVRTYTNSLEIDPSIAILAVLLSVLLGYLSWRYIERPFRVSPSAGGISARSIFMASGAGAATLVAVAGLIFFDEGAERRLPPELLAAYKSAVARSQLEEDCRAGDPVSGLCMFGAPPGARPGPDILVWGDSHAGAMAPGFDLWARQHGLVASAAIKNACPPMLEIVRINFSPDNRCDVFNDGIIRYLEDHPSIETVILVARWALYAEGKRLFGDGGPSYVLGLSRHANAAGLDGGNPALFSFGLSRTLQRLNELGRKVVLVEAVPEMKYSVPSGLVSGGLSGRPYPLLSRREFDERNARTLAIFEKLGEDYSFDRISMADVLCKTSCMIEFDGDFLYRDKDHLTVAASKRFVPMALNR